MQTDFKAGQVFRASSSPSETSTQSSWKIYSSRIYLCLCRIMSALLLLLYLGLLCVFTISNVQPDKCTLAYSIYVELTSALPPLHGLLDFN
jgi:hypothetical protein